MNNVGAILAITLERTMCYGPCPVFTARFINDGVLEYDGQFAVQPLGARRIQLRRDGFAQLAALVEREGFWDLEANYAAQVTDLPSRIITVQAESQSKIVTDYGLVGPIALHRIERAITERLKRVGVGRPNNPFSSEEGGMATPGQKAAATRKRRAAGKKAATTRKRRMAGKKAAVTRRRRLAGKKAAVTKRRSKAAKKAAATRAAHKAANVPGTSS